MHTYAEIKQGGKGTVKNLTDILGGYEVSDNEIISISSEGNLWYITCTKSVGAKEEVLEFKLSKNTQTKKVRFSLEVDV